MDDIERLVGAVQERNLEEVESALSRGVDWENDNLKAYDLLHVAAQNGDSGILDLLLRTDGVKAINDFDITSMTPLMWAAQGNHYEAISILLKAGADPNLFDEEMVGNTALREVVDTCTFETAELLVKGGARSNIRGWMQMTALDVAVARSKREGDEESRKILALLKS